MSEINLTPKSHRCINEIGKRFGRLTVVSYAGISGKGASWHCVCDCGNKRIVQASNLRNASTVSCGCLAREKSRLRATHGMRHSPEYKAWRGMISRCENQNSKAYRLYGGRGITVCDRWRNSFKAFFQDMGPRPSSKHSIDRIDCNGNYEPSNCRWATSLQQQRNRRNNRILELNGKSYCVSEWAQRLGIPENAIWARMRHGWSVERILTEPVRNRS